MKILFLTNIPSPYRVAFFNELGKKCDLTVCFERKTASDRNKMWRCVENFNFKPVFLRGIKYKKDKSISFSIIKYIKKDYYDFVISSNFSSFTGILAIFYMHFKRIRYILEADGAFIKNGKGFKEFVKRKIVSGAYAFFSPSMSTDEYFNFYGGNKSMIKRYNFTSIHKKDIAKALLTKQEKLQLRRKLNIKGDFIILSVGNFIKRKGFDTLIKASVFLNGKVEIYIIGSTPSKEYLKIIKDNNLDNINFINFQPQEELKKYYLASDLFVFPTRYDIWGLVINEAMSNGLPIITTLSCGSGLELVSNDNGILVKADDEKELADACNYFIQNRVECIHKGEKSLFKISNYTIENMAEQHICILRDLKNAS